MIVSIENAKAFLNREVDERLLEMKLTALEYFVRRYTGNNFQLRSVRSHSAVSGGRITNPPETVKTGDTVEITQSLYNNGIYTVTDTQHGLSVSEPLQNCTDNLVTKVFYPPDVVNGVLQLLDWQLDNVGKIGIASERISRYSVTYFDMNDGNSVMGYPKSLLGFLKPYMKARF